MKKIRYIYKYCIHFLTARNTKGYGVHSPFLFHLIRNVMREEEPYYVFRSIESLRFQLKRNRNYIYITDFGTSPNRKERISTVANHALKEASQAQLLFRIIHYIKAKKVLELGTSLGITTMYLASSSSDIECISIEGCPALSNIAQQNFNRLGLHNIKLVNARIEEVLGDVLGESGTQDFVYIDANHRYQPLLQYFEQILNYTHTKTVVVLDDIYWSREMEDAWKKIKNHPKVTATIDVFHMGIVFLDPMFEKKNYKVRF